MKNIASVEEAANPDGSALRYRRSPFWPNDGPHSQWKLGQWNRSHAAVGPYHS
jgi:hypothetical protein